MWQEVTNVKDSAEVISSSILAVATCTNARVVHVAVVAREPVRANKAKSLLRFRNSGDCSGKQSKAHRAPPVCFALHSKQSERLVGLLQKANKPKSLLLLHFRDERCYEKVPGRRELRLLGSKTVEPPADGAEGAGNFGR